MKRILLCILLGLQDLPRYGDHPGTPIIVWLLVIGALAGGWIGALLMGAVFGPIYLIGAYDRGNDHLKDQQLK